MEDRRHGEGQLSLPGPTRCGYVAYSGMWKTDSITGHGEMRLQNGGKIY